MKKMEIERRLEQAELQRAAVNRSKFFEAQNTIGTRAYAAETFRKN